MSPGSSKGRAFHAHSFFREGMPEKSNGGKGLGRVKQGGIKTNPRLLN